LPPGGKALPPGDPRILIDVTESAAFCVPRALARRLQGACRKLDEKHLRGPGKMKLQPFAPHVEALELRALRHRVLSSNIANADTPHYKARDIDFASALSAARSESLGLARTSARHLAGSGAGSAAGGAVRYRVPTQPSLDGNTVETDVEQAAFADNAIRYRASLEFLDAAIRKLRYAIKGGD